MIYRAVFREVFLAYKAALLPKLWLAACLVVFAVLFVMPQVRTQLQKMEDRIPEKWRGWFRRVPLLLTIVGALVVGWSLLWICDDALISFHYARNWVNGHGLVFNPGEVVEAYTNFLWLFLMAVAYRLNLDPPIVSVVLSFASFVVVIVACKWLVEKALAKTTAISLSAIAVGFCFPVVSFATSGLETMFCTALVLVSVCAAIEAKFLLAGLLGIFATMGHPDHSLFYVALGLALLWNRTPWRGLVRYGLPFVAIYLPYFLIRWHYYGYLMPNSFYTKSGEGWYLSQGSFYLLASMLIGSTYTALPAALLGIVHLRKTLLGRFMVIALPLYIVYVAKIGGDFMTGRLLVPALPLLFVAAEIAVRHWFKKPVLAGLLLAPMVLLCIHTPVHKHQEFRWMLTDERTFYEVETLRPLRLKGKIPRRVHMLAEYLGNSVPAPSYAAYAVGYIAWLTNWRIVDIHGLLDPVLSHQPLKKRGRPGHEREATPARILEQKADISTKPLYTDPWAKMTFIKLDEQGYWLAHYLPELLEPLRGNPKVQFTDFPAYLDQYILTVASNGANKIKNDLKFFDSYYFSVNDDLARRQPIADALAAKSVPRK